jgi:hypothetical protein
MSVTLSLEQADIDLLLAMARIKGRSAFTVNSETLSDQLNLGSKAAAAKRMQRLRGRIFGVEVSSIHS